MSESGALERVPPSRYAALCAPLDDVGALPKGGQQFPFAPIESVVARLNDVLGVDGWSFRVLDSGRDADTMWALGRLTVHGAFRDVIREQFGECDVTRGMGAGDARKGAVSDALKKAATLIGVGLYLAAKETPAANAPRPARPAPAPRPPVTAPTGAAPVTPPPANGPPCEDCKQLLRPYRTPGGKSLTAPVLATTTRATFGRVLCGACASKAVAK